MDKEQAPELRVPERREHLHMIHIPPRVGDEERARWVVEEDRGRRELRVYPQPVHMLVQVRGGPEVVEPSRNLEGKVVQQVHFANLLGPETLPKRLQARRLQAVTGQVPVRETVMRRYKHRGMDLPEEYMRCDCGCKLQTYEHCMRCEWYKEMDGLLVRDQDIPLLKNREKGRNEMERELGGEEHRKGLWHRVIVKLSWRGLLEGEGSPNTRTETSGTEGGSSNRARAAGMEGKNTEVAGWTGTSRGIALPPWTGTSGASGENRHLRS